MGNNNNTPNINKQSVYVGLTQNGVMNNAVLLAIFDALDTDHSKCLEENNSEYLIYHKQNVKKEDKINDKH